LAATPNSATDDNTPCPLLPTRNFVIAVPPKTWRPKPVDRYIPLDHSNDIDEQVFEFEQHGKAFCHPPEPFSIERDDIHTWNRDRDFAEFEKNFVISSLVPMPPLQ
jgi:hypothetical protein